MANMKVVARMVAEEGRDAAAEERIVLRLVSQRPPAPDGYVNTDQMRHQIRKIQGRKRRERIPGDEKDVNLG